MCEIRHISKLLGDFAFALYHGGTDVVKTRNSGTTKKNTRNIS